MTDTHEAPQEQPQEGAPEQPETFDAEYVAKLRKEAAKYRTEAKANADAAKRLAEIEESTKTESQKQAERIAELEQQIEQTQAAALKAQVAARFGVSTEPDEETGLSDADLFLTGKDEETLTAQAKRLAKRVSDRESTNNISPTEGGTPRVVPDEKSAFADFLTGHRTA